MLTIMSHAVYWSCKDEQENEEYGFTTKHEISVCIILMGLLMVWSSNRLHNPKVKVPEQKLPVHRLSAQMKVLYYTTAFQPT